MTTKQLLLIISFAGLLVSGYLLISYVTPVPLVCDTTGGCEVVRLSTYASFFGIPTPLYGVVFYTTLGILAALERYNYVRWLTAIGFVISVYLSYLEAFVIEAWCLWCVVSAVLSTLALVVAWWPQRPKQPELSEPPPAQPSLA